MSEQPGRDGVAADTTTMTAFGHEAAALAAGLQDAAERTRLGEPGALAPVLGAVGAPFLAGLAATHHAHVRDLGRLGDLLAGMGAAAIASASAYERSTLDTAARLVSAAASVERTEQP